jgi:hypothetical protein
MATTSVHTVIYNDKEYIIRIEKKPYLLNKTIQPVYNYYYIQEGNIKELLTYYTNGCDKDFFPVYHDLVNYPKHILDTLLKNLLPQNLLPIQK